MFSNFCWIYFSRTDFRLRTVTLCAYNKDYVVVLHIISVRAIRNLPHFIQLGVAFIFWIFDDSRVLPVY